jgi:hypothetical protein
MFVALFAYDQHRRSRVLRGTACCALPEDNRFNVTAAPRPNMSTQASTAALERRPAIFIAMINYYFIMDIN